MINVHSEGTQTIAIHVFKAKNIESPEPLSSQIFKVLIKFSECEKQTKASTGIEPLWNQEILLENFHENSKHNLYFHLYMGNKEIGVKDFKSKRIVSQFLNRGKQTIKLEKNTAELQIMIDDMKTSSTIDYYESPRITFAPDYEKYKKSEGFQYGEAQKNNFFSCCDGEGCDPCGQKEFEFFPDKFQTSNEE